MWLVIIMGWWSVSLISRPRLISSFVVVIFLWHIDSENVRIFIRENSIYFRQKITGTFNDSAKKFRENETKSTCPPPIKVYETLVHARTIDQFCCLNILVLGKRSFSLSLNVQLVCQKSCCSFITFTWSWFWFWFMLPMRPHWFKAATIAGLIGNGFMFIPAIIAFFQWVYRYVLRNKKSQSISFVQRGIKC